MSQVIPVRVPKDVVERINRLVDLGVFPNRSSLVREALRRLSVSEEREFYKSAFIRDVAVLASCMIVWNEKSVSDVILFGSVARGEATVESDVDLLVLIENVESWVARRRLYDLIYPIIAALGVDISLVVFEKKRFMEMVRVEDPFAVTVLKEGIQLYGGFLIEHCKSAFRKGFGAVEGC